MSSEKNIGGVLITLFYGAYELVYKRHRRGSNYPDLRGYCLFSVLPPWLLASYPRGEQLTGNNSGGAILFGCFSSGCLPHIRVGISLRADNSRRVIIMAGLFYIVYFLWFLWVFPDDPRGPVKRLRGLCIF